MDQRAVQQIQASIEPQTPSVVYIKVDAAQNSVGCALGDVQTRAVFLDVCGEWPEWFEGEMRDELEFFSLVHLLQ